MKTAPDMNRGVYVTIGTPRQKMAKQIAAATNPAMRCEAPSVRQALMVIPVCKKVVVPPVQPQTRFDKACAFNSTPKSSGSSLGHEASTEQPPMEASSKEMMATETMSGMNATTACTSQCR
mmetsp:Transcript_107794/g.190938  ORF Transcript_107794/g.190938 Transcript_107794/m.190938 type:complete len:121 (-) Transcript_107794:358-720(-)